MSYEFFIARRHLQRRVTTFISIGGIFVGVASLLIVMSVTNGFHKDLREKILTATPDIIVTKFYSKPVEDYMRLKEKIEKLPGIEGVSPYIYTKSMIRGKESMDGIMLRGELLTPDMKDKIIWGNFSLGENGIVLGKNLADAMNVFTGDTVTLFGIPYGKNPGFMSVRNRKFVVNGIFDSGLYDYNSSLAYISFAALQRFLSLGNNATGIAIKVKDVDRAGTISKTINRELGYPYRAIPWMELNTSLFSALRIEKLTMFILLSLVIIVAVFNVIATLIMTVTRKTREIGILLSMGATPKSIKRIFTLQGLTVGLIGTVVGVGVGFLLSYLLGKYHFISLPQDVYNIQKMPVCMQLSDFIIVPVCTIIITFFASLYPAWRASKLLPVDAIRYE
jgi:lipoprotein-releasing system permease protein